MYIVLDIDPALRKKIVFFARPTPLSTSKKVKLIGLPITFNSPETSFGFGRGVRFKFVKDQDILLRLGFGFGEDNRTGLYFGVNEVF